MGPAYRLVGFRHLRETCGLDVQVELVDGGSNNGTSAKVSCIGNLTRIFEISWPFKCVERVGYRLRRTKPHGRVNGWESTSVGESF
jgi:hypothetical protein